VIFGRQCPAKRAQRHTMLKHVPGQGS